jgi:tetratricopeptide (TPR) repeat protein
LAGWEWLFLGVLIAAVFLAYQPVWQGEFIWDDDTHLLNNPVLRPGGVFRTWVPGTYCNYWPVTSTAYWVQYKLWGLSPVGFHLVNIALHAVSAILIWRILGLMRVPGALFAAALFALHPVNVESVAWITQLKNTLSLALTLLSVLLYLRHEQHGGRWLFISAVVVFGLATLAKGMTLTLPVVLLACVWWRRGRIERGDVLRLVPYVLIGLAMIGMELFQQHVSAGQTVVRSDGLLSRTAVAGCAVWFYFWKLIWPVDLMFVYPRWNLGAVSTLWFLPGLVLAAIFVLAWRWRRSWGRPVLMLIVCYVALLLPALGFVNIYFMEFSLVADHWQYAAMIVPCAAFAGAAAALSRRRGSRLPGALLCLVLLATLAGLTWRQCRMYADIETLYRTTINENPDCWMAHNNLGDVLQGRGRIDEAIIHYLKALEIRPDYAEAHNNLGIALAKRGRLDEAIAHYQKALKIKPDYAGAHNSLGAALIRRGRLDEAISHFKRTLEIDPGYMEAYNNLGYVLAGRGQLAEAITYYRKALTIEPDCAIAQRSLGMALARCGQLDEAISHFRKALQINPRDERTHNDLGMALAAQGRIAEAIVHYQKALEIRPTDVEACCQLGAAFQSLGRIDAAIAQYQQTLKINPDCVDAQNNLAWLLATGPAAALRNGGEAIKHAQRANQLYGGKKPDVLDTLAAAYAEAGRFPEAIATARHALESAMQKNNRPLADVLRSRIALYEVGKPFHQAPSASSPPPKP